MQNEEKKLADLLTPIHDLGSGLYIGNKSGAYDAELLRSLDIQHMIKCDTTTKPDTVDGIYTIVVPIGDKPDTDLLKWLPLCMARISLAKLRDENILVHCDAGCSRSASIVIAWFMKSTNVDYDTALTRLQSVRSCVSPNVGFEATLRSWA